MGKMMSSQGDPKLRSSRESDESDDDPVPGTLGTNVFSVVPADGTFADVALMSAFRNQKKHFAVNSPVNDKVKMTTFTLDQQFDFEK